MTNAERISFFALFRRKKGLSLIESAIVLGIVGLVIGGIWVAAATVQENRRQARFLEQIVHIASAVGNSAFNNITTPASVAFAFLDQAAAENIRKDAWPAFLPADVITSSPYPTSPWGWPMTIGLMSNLRQVDFYAFVPKSTCVSLAPRIAGLGNQGVKIKKTIMGYSVVLADTPLVALDTPALAAANCTATSYPATADTPAMTGSYIYFRVSY